MVNGKHVIKNLFLKDELSCLNYNYSVFVEFKSELYNKWRVGKNVGNRKCEFLFVYLYH